MNEQPLTGVRIVDLSIAHAGPFGSQLLADLGAEVIKIEPPDTGEIARDLSPKLEGEGYYFLALNRNKKSVCLNLYTELGKQAFYDLVKISNVVYDNLRGGVLERLGADYKTLKTINPHIISCSITGLGSSGPYQGYATFNDIAQGYSGMSSLCGEPGGKPMRSPVAIADISAGIFSAMGIIAALYQNRETGLGKRIEVNLLDSCMALMATEFQYYFATGQVPPPPGSRHPTAPLLGVFKAKDKYITLGPSWPRIARVINKDCMIDDPRFATLEAKQQHRKELEDEVEEALQQAPAVDWLELLHAEDIPAGPVNTLDEVIRDPQVIHNQAVITTQHPKCGEIKGIACPIKLEGIEGEQKSPPSLGQHTEEVLRKLLGYSEDRIEEMHKQAREHQEELIQHVRRRL